MSSELENAQRVLEQNEDILAAIVENLQLGRLNDCMQHYAILQANLVSLATHLDNFPAEENDPYTKLDIFPDEIMRKDLLEDFRPAGSKPLPQPPVIPPCADCIAKKNTALMCRGTLKHIEPSGKYSAAEREEFFNVTQVLAARPLPNKQEPGGKKRVYKVWAPFEKYSLLVALSIFGTDMHGLTQALEDRNADQIRNYITKKLKKGDKWTITLNAVDLMNHRPPGYQPPPILAPYFAAHAMGLDPDTVQFTGFVPPAAPNGLDPAATTSTESLLAPEAGKPDFNLLLSIAAGVSTHNPDELPTRVPPAPVESPTASDGQSNDIAIITDVGLEQAQGGGSAARLEAAYKAAAAAATSRFTTMGPPTMGPPSAKHSQFLHHTARAPVSQDNSFVSQASARRVHWDESLPRAENNEVSGSSFPSLPPLPVAAPAGLLNPLRSMNAAQGTETQPMSYYAQQQHNQLQQETSEQMAEQERRHREESALMGLETYQLEYARRLQAYNVSFKMTSGAGTVVVQANGAVGTSSSGGAAGTGAGAGAGAGGKSQPPPFARPGMQRMKKQQLEARQQELRQQQQGHPSDPSQAPAQSSQAPQVQAPSSGRSSLLSRITAGVYTDMPPGGLHYPIHTDAPRPAQPPQAQALLHSQRDGQAGSAEAEDSFAARLQAALKPRASPSNGKGTKARKPKEGNGSSNGGNGVNSAGSVNKPGQGISQLLSQPIPVVRADNTNNPAQPSLFSRILSGTNIETGSSQRTNTNNTNNNTGNNNAHTSAALDVSMSGFDDTNSNMEVVVNEELSVLPEFGCEFSFL